MVIPKSLKLNRFRIVQIPSAKDMVDRVGQSLGNNYTGDEIAPANQSKLDMMLDMDARNGNALAKELSELDPTK